MVFKQHSLPPTQLSLLEFDNEERKSEEGAPEINRYLASEIASTVPVAHAAPFFG